MLNPLLNPCPNSIPKHNKDVWNVGLLLQSEDALSVFHEEWRPWTKVTEDTAESQEFYIFHERHKQVPNNFLHPYYSDMSTRRVSKKARLAFLTEQYHARVSCRNPRLYPGLGSALTYICLHCRVFHAWSSFVPS
jgi:hypothetical protein